MIFPTKNNMQQSGTNKVKGKMEGSGSKNVPNLVK